MFLFFFLNLIYKFELENSYFFLIKAQTLINLVFKLLREKTNNTHSHTYKTKQQKSHPTDNDILIQYENAVIFPEVLNTVSAKKT